MNLSEMPPKCSKFITQLEELKAVKSLPFYSDTEREKQSHLILFL